MDSGLSLSLSPSPSPSPSLDLSPSVGLGLGQLLPVYQSQLLPVYRSQLLPVYQSQLLPVYRSQLLPVYPPQPPTLPGQTQVFITQAIQTDHRNDMKAETTLSRLIDTNYDLLSSMVNDKIISRFIRLVKVHTLIEAPDPIQP